MEKSGIRKASTHVIQNEGLLFEESRPGRIGYSLPKLDVPETQTEILGLDAENFTGREHALGWDIAFYDPPYEADYSIVLHEFGFRKPLLNDGGVLIVEHHAKHKMPDAVGGLRRWRILKQGETSLSFYEHDQ